LVQRCAYSGADMCPALMSGHSNAAGPKFAGQVRTLAQAPCPDLVLPRRLTVKSLGLLPVDPVFVVFVPKTQHRGCKLAYWNALSLPKNIGGIIL
jgi:hypothetical protein